MEADVIAETAKLRPEAGIRERRTGGPESSRPSPELLLDLHHVERLRRTDRCHDVGRHTAKGRAIASRLDERGLAGAPAAQASATLRLAAAASASALALLTRWRIGAPGR